jgi:predicted PhzF superfamily epimerase YddE/YHI9
MDFPATRPEVAPLPPMASDVLAVSGPVTCAGKTAMNLTLVLPDEMQVRACNPNLGILAGWHQTGVIVTAAAMTPGIDFVSRFFAPRSGIPEVQSPVPLIVRSLCTGPTDLVRVHS